MLYEFIKQRMLEYPDQIISDGNQVLTYSEMIKQAESLGNQLTEEKYGLLCDSDFDTAISLLACFYARKTAIPLSKKYGDKHISKIIEKTQLAYLITSNGVVRIADAMPESEDLTDVALIMCTSGTTGVPKGAMITEKNLVNNLNDIEKYFPDWVAFSEEYAYAEEEAEAQEIYQNRERLLRELLAELETALQKYTK